MYRCLPHGVEVTYAWRAVNHQSSCLLEEVPVNQTLSTIERPEVVLNVILKWLVIEKGIELPSKLPITENNQRNWINLLFVSLLYMLSFVLRASNLILLHCSLYFMSICNDLNKSLLKVFPQNYCPSSTDRFSLTKGQCLFLNLRLNFGIYFIDIQFQLVPQYILKTWKNFNSYKKVGRKD